MSAFDTSTNTGSATFTNAYSTVMLESSASVQKAGGFTRTTGWRYFEWHIDDNGGDNSRLFVGLGSPPQFGALDPNYLLGGDSKRAYVVGSTFSPAYPYEVATSVTACAGDVFMFAVDMTGQARNHAGVVSVASLPLMSSDGRTLTVCYVEVGKNGVWNVASQVGFAWPAMGFPMQAKPWAVRDSTSTSPAMVTLKVQTTSFAYALPTGMVAWGDGPEGGVAAVDDFALAWDPTKNFKWSLSGSNYYAIPNKTGEFPTTGSVMTTNLSGLTGKRYMEIWQQSPYNMTEQQVGVLDADTITNTQADNSINALVWKIATQVWRRGTSISACVTNDSLAPVTGDVAIPGCGMAIDFDNKLFWHCQPFATTTFIGPWLGDSTVPAGGFSPSPYSWGALASVAGVPLSITASTTQLRIAMKMRNDAAAGPSAHYINGGQVVFSFYPLLPGVRSMNGGRFITPGQGDSWDVVNNPASATYGCAGLSIRKRYLGAAQCAQTKFSGKRYFEIHTEQDGGTTGGVYVGVRRGSATTMTAASIAALIDQALVVRVSGGSTARLRYGVNIGSWTATSSYYSSGGVGYMAGWHGIAIDFDAGRMWVGSWNYATKVMNWGASSDPATGVSPHFTFTASETMRICVVDVLTNDLGATGGVWGRVNLVQDDLNVVGKPNGFETWGGTAPTSLTATPSPSPSASLAASIRNIWPTGMIG